MKKHCIQEKGEVMSESNGEKSCVLNDDVLSLILSRLSIKELFPAKQVSQQFRDCVQRVLREKREVSIGFNDSIKDSDLEAFKPRSDWKCIDITEAIAQKSIILSTHPLKTIVGQFRGVKKIYLSTTQLSCETVELFVHQFPLLESLNFRNIDIDGMNDAEVITKWVQILSKIRHLSVVDIKEQYLPFLVDIISKLPSIRSLENWRYNSLLDLFEENITLSSLAIHLPSNMKSLFLVVTTLDTQAFDTITSNCSRLRKLTLSGDRDYTQTEIDVWNEWFVMTCDRLKDLKNLTTNLGNISVKSLAENIAKPKELKHLSIGSFYTMSSLRFDTQLMASYVKPMVSLRTLSIGSFKSSPNRWSKIDQMLPNVRQLTIDGMNCHMDCNSGTDCSQCLHKCMTYVSKMAQLKCITINANEVISLQTLKLLVGVDQLTILGHWLTKEENEHLAEEFAENLIDFVTQSLVSIGRVFRLEVMSSISLRMTTKMVAMDLQMPENVIVNKMS